MIDVWIDDDGDVNWIHTWLAPGQEESLHGYYLQDRAAVDIGLVGVELSFRWMILT